MFDFLRKLKQPHIKNLEKVLGALINNKKDILASFSNDDLLKENKDNQILHLKVLIEEIIDEMEKLNKEIKLKCEVNNANVNNPIKIPLEEKNINFNIKLNDNQIVYIIEKLIKDANENTESILKEITLLGDKELDQPWIANNLNMFLYIRYICDNLYAIPGVYQNPGSGIDRAMRNVVEIVLSRLQILQPHLIDIQFAKWELNKKSFFHAVLYFIAQYVYLFSGLRNHIINFGISCLGLSNPQKLIKDNIPQTARGFDIIYLLTFLTYAMPLVTTLYQKRNDIAQKITEKTSPPLLFLYNKGSDLFNATHEFFGKMYGYEDEETDTRVVKLQNN